MHRWVVNWMDDALSIEWKFGCELNGQCVVHSMEVRWPLWGLFRRSGLRWEKRPEQGIFASGCQCFSKTRNIRYHENHKGHISFVAFEALISSVPEQYIHFADDKRFCYNTHYKKKRGVKMIRKSLALFLIALPVLNASASYQIDSSYPFRRWAGCPACIRRRDMVSFAAF